MIIERHLDYGRRRSRTTLVVARVTVGAEKGVKHTGLGDCGTGTLRLAAPLHTLLQSARFLLLSALCRHSSCNLTNLFWSFNSLAGLPFSFIGHHDLSPQ